MSADSYTTVVSDEQVRVVAKDGTRVQIIPANTPTAIHPKLVAPAIEAGCKTTSGEVLQTKSHDEIVADLVDAMEKIMAEGVEEKMTKHDGPRVASLKMHVADFTEAQRAEAWAILSDAPAETTEDE